MSVFVCVASLSERFSVKVRTAYRFYTLVHDAWYNSLDLQVKTYSFCIKKEKFKYGAAFHKIVRLAKLDERDVLE